MRDRYGREIDYLRISVTDRCNLRCVYCMPEEGVTLLPHQEILSFEEMLSVCRAAVKLGIRHIKVTGGEPLVRKGVVEFVGNLKQMEGIETVTLTTNGVFLPDYMEALSRAGIDGINISLDTLNGEKFRKITRNGDLEQVLAGIRSAVSTGDIRVKVNCVLDGEDWEKDALSVAELAKKYPIHVRFIELMPLMKQTEPRGKECRVRNILENTYGRMEPCAEKMGYGPSVYYEIEGFYGKIGFISAVSHKFCSQCNRIRLTCDGILRTCLQSDRGTDLKTPLREGVTEEELARLIEAALTEKPREHHFDSSGIQAESMSKIGG